MESECVSIIVRGASSYVQFGETTPIQPLFGLIDVTPCTQYVFNSNINNIGFNGEAQ